MDSNYPSLAPVLQMAPVGLSGSLGQLAGGGGGVGSSGPLGLLSSSVDTAVPKERVNLKREKNKIASRACRLKKKAQHEANKIKLFGLNDEHSECWMS